MEQDDGREDDLNSLNTQITPRPTVFAVAAATEESQTSLTRGPVEPVEAVDPTPARGGIWTGVTDKQLFNFFWKFPSDDPDNSHQLLSAIVHWFTGAKRKCRRLPPAAALAAIQQQSHKLYGKNPEGEVVFELAEDDIEREEDTHVVGMNQHMGERSEESRRGTKKAEIKTMKKQRSRGEGKGENEGEIKVEEEVEMERNLKKGEGESGEFHREREAEAEADGDAAKPRSGMGEEKEEQNGRNRWKRERWVDRPPLTHLRLASSSALVRELRRVGNRGEWYQLDLHPPTCRSRARSSRSWRRGSGADRVRVGGGGRRAERCVLLGLGMGSQPRLKVGEGVGVLVSCATLLRAQHQLGLFSLFCGQMLISDTFDGTPVQARAHEPQAFRGQVHVAAAVARREKPSIEPPDITPEGPPPAQGESMHVAPAAGNKNSVVLLLRTPFSTWLFLFRRRRVLRALARAGPSIPSPSLIAAR
ncbi:hypothetical protein B0H14DRAFT_3750858 [Mycena olivaceomarginata]|nr:hypothetical protein B0H14DRAFT_3750858 [Mycena olivaceomarginata]